MPEKEKNMENTEIEKINAKKKEEKNEEIYRVGITGFAEKALAKLLEQVNDGFEGGRVNRTQITSWLVLKGSNEITEQEIQDIRSEHFDEVAMLEALLKKTREGGNMPPELRLLLQKQMGTFESPKKRSKKQLTTDNINDVILKKDIDQ